MIRFFVAGVPAPQGSKDHVGGGRMVESSKALKPWREQIGWSALSARRGTPLFVGPVKLDLEFVMRRPKAMRADQPTPPHLNPPDVDKLERAVLDALTRTLYVDDALVVDLHGRKRTAEPGEQSGVHIIAEAIP